MFYRNQNNIGQKKTQSEDTFKTRLVASFKKNYTTSLLLIGMVVGCILDWSLGTMPRYTCGGMVIGIFVGSAMSVKARNEEKERQQRLEKKQTKSKNKS